MTRAIAAPCPQAGREGGGAAGWGELGWSLRSLPALHLVFWETWMSPVPSAALVHEVRGGEVQLLPGTLLENLWWEAGNPQPSQLWG